MGSESLASETHVFITAHEEHSEGAEVKLWEKLEQHGYNVFIFRSDTEMKQGGPRYEEVLEALGAAKIAIVLGTKHYGKPREKTFSTDKVLKFLMNDWRVQEGKTLILMKMCNNFEVKSTTKALADVLMEEKYLTWKVGTEPQLEHVASILTRLHKVVGTVNPYPRMEPLLSPPQEDGFAVVVRESKGKKSYYAGTWQNGIAHGAGKYVGPDGSFYEGSYVNGSITGMGTYRYGSKYNNSFGDIYRGEFSNSKRQGIGTIIFSPFGPNAGATYFGAWNNNNREGVGTQLYRNGRRYTGDWKLDKRHGKGELFSKTFRYSGDWRKGRRSGEGEIVYQNGNRYTGGFLNNHAHGEGEEYSDKTGNLFKGQFKGGHREGKGMLYYGENSDFPGCTLEGIWKKGNREGIFVFTNSAKDVSEQHYKGDKLVT